MSLTLSCDHGVGEIAIERPDRLNSLDLDDFRLLRELIDRALAAGVRALLLRGEGTAFCTGRNLKGIGPDEDIGASVRLINDVLLAWHRAPVPTLAAVQGPCLGAGVGLALLADLTLAGDSCRVGSPFGRLGAVADSGFHPVITHRLGGARAKDLLLTGRRLSGAEAAATGLVARCLPDDALLTGARDLARELASGPTTAFASSLALVDEATDDPALARSLEGEARAQAAISGTADFRAGLAAFVAKQRPVFTGR